MRALILVFLLSTLTTILAGYPNYYPRPTSRPSCDDVVSKGLCYYQDVLTKFGDVLAKRLMAKCCKESDVAKKVIVITGAGDKFAKMLGGFFKPLDFCDVVDKADACPTCCAVNGHWGQWAESTCSASCGVGVQTRVRFCDSPPPSNGGDVCPGSGTEERSCILSECPAEICASFDGYTFDNATGCCIGVFQTVRNFFGAEKECMNDGGMLLKLDSIAKRDFLQTLVQDDNANNFFIGARDINGMDEFEHLDHTPVDWIGTLPTQSNKDCVRYQKNQMALDEAFCSNQHKFVCERET